MNPETVKARAGALGAGVTGPAAGYAVLLAINQVVPDAHWAVRTLLFCLVAAAIGYWHVWRAPANRPKDGGA